MKKTKKELIKEELADFGKYISEGIKEEGKDRGLSVKSTHILSVDRGKMPESIFLMQQFCHEVSVNRRYSSNTYRVLFCLFSISQFENFISIDVKSIAERLGMDPKSVSRATRDLANDNIIIKQAHPTDGRRIDYFFNPMAAWRGKAMNRTKTIKNLMNKKVKLDMFWEQGNLFSNPLLTTTTTTTTTIKPD